jgi:hypothetical protein
MHEQTSNKQTRSEPVKATNSTKAPAKAPAESDGCQCACHFLMFQAMPDAARIALAPIDSNGFLAARTQAPPDALPIGIEYPPQLS